MYYCNLHEIERHWKKHYRIIHLNSNISAIILNIMGQILQLKDKVHQLKDKIILKNYATYKRHILFFKQIC